MSLAPMKKFRTKTTQQYKDNSFFTAWQTDETLASEKAYWDNSVSYPITAVASGTVTQIATSGPLKGTKFGTTWTPESTDINIPLVGRATNYTRIVGTAVTDGAKLDVGKWNISNDKLVGGKLVLVCKSSIASQAFTVTLRTSTGNEEKYSFTSSVATNTWSFKALTLGTGVVTGIMDYANITYIEVLCNGTIDVAMSYVVNDLLQILGQEVTLDYSCVMEHTFNDSVDIADVICNNLVKEKTPTGRKIEFTFKTTEKDLKANAMFLGESVKRETQKIPTTLSSATVGAKYVITSAIVTLGASLDIARVKVDGQVLDLALSATTVDQNSYYYNSTTGVMTFDASFEGKYPQIIVYNSATANVVRMAGLKTGMVGTMFIPRETDGTTTMYRLNRVQLVKVEESPADAADEVTYTCAALPDDNGVFGYIIQF